MKKGFSLVMFAIMLFPSALWGLSWSFSAYRHATNTCQGEFSLFHPEMLCREPYIALTISAIIGVLSIFIMVAGVRSIERGS